MQAGKLRHRVDLENDTASTRDGHGQLVPIWSAEASNLPCDIQTLRGRELVEAQQVVGEATHRVRMRYRSGVTVKKRLLFGTRELNIGFVENVGERNREWLLICVERI
ncbi:MAG: phage head closure protein [Planctomycetes bacterium]|nr:phage head closure protein [Planctomycetota bacterium]